MLLGFGLGLAVLEVFFPSAGILGFLSACAIVASVVVGFRQSHQTGFIMVMVAVVGVPAVVIAGLKVWPHTAMGRRILLMASDEQDVLPSDPEIERLRSLIGQVAETKCKMLPAGAIVVDGRTFDAISEGMPIEAGQPVRIIEVRAHRVVVRPLEDDAPPEPPRDDQLAQTFDDPFDDAPA
jgi:membrane-bound serine protease (ClpP class)